MADSIAAAIIETLKSFNEFIDLVRNPSTPNVEGLSIGRWEDELGRLRMWAANIGAHRIGQSSLDYRLRDASHIRQQVLKLLEIVRRRLKDAREVLDEDSECDNDSSSDGEDSNPDEPAEIVQIQDSVATMISCLFQMSMLIRNPTKHDVRRESYRSEISAFAPYDYNHVREKFPKANEVLISRLGTAITQKRKYLNYRERHAAKLKQGLSGGASGTDTATIGGLSDTIATDPQQRNIDFDDHGSDSGVSQTSYAPTLKDGGNITIPPAPKASLNGDPFECPICYHIIALDRSHSWAKHVFQDLQPYLCLEVDCVTPQKMYTNRREWIYHMRNVHNQSERQQKPDGETPSLCPLCDFVCVNLGYLHKHVARHMQELALFVLPQDDEDLDQDSNSNEVLVPLAGSLLGEESLDEEENHSAIDDTSNPELAWDPEAHAAEPEQTGISISELYKKSDPNDLPTYQSFKTSPTSSSFGSEDKAKMTNDAVKLKRRIAQDSGLIDAEKIIDNPIMLESEIQYESNLNYEEIRKIQKEKIHHLLNRGGRGTSTLHHYRCCDCNRSFRSLPDLRKHEQTHSRPWKCPEPSCIYNNLGYFSEKERNRHFNDEHAGMKTMFRCRFLLCNYESKREINCKQHMEKVHGWKSVRSEEQQSKEDAVGDRDIHVQEIEETVDSMPVSPSWSEAGDSVSASEDPTDYPLPVNPAKDANDLGLFDSRQLKQDTPNEVPGPRKISESSAISTSSRQQDGANSVTSPESEKENPTTQKREACTPCRKRQVKCTYNSDQSICDSCFRSANPRACQIPKGPQIKPVSLHQPDKGATSGLMDLLEGLDGL